METDRSGISNKTVSLDYCHMNNLTVGSFSFFVKLKYLMSWSCESTNVYFVPGMFPSTIVKSMIGSVLCGTNSRTGGSKSGNKVI